MGARAGSVQVRVDLVFGWDPDVVISAVGRVRCIYGDLRFFARGCRIYGRFGGLFCEVGMRDGFGRFFNCLYKIWKLIFSAIAFRIKFLHMIELASVFNECLQTILCR